MGEATPAHPNTGGFAPMLGGVGMGSMPGGVNGGPMVAASRGSSVPQLHSAIVERLRARIELCRRHHATCESRYQRGEAERSDRGHESTLHLLNIVHQQGTGTRKAKGGRGSNQQPSADYSRTNGEQKSQNSEGGDNKLSTRIAVSLLFVFLFLSKLFLWLVVMVMMVMVMMVMVMMVTVMEMVTADGWGPDYHDAMV